MNNRLFRIAVFIVVLLSLSCVNEFDATPVKTVNGSSNESTRTLADSVSSVNMLISAMGYDATMIVDKGTYFLVEDTYRFYKEDIASFLNECGDFSPQTRLANNNRIIGKHYRKISISSVYDSTGDGEDRVGFIESALVQWNDAKSDIQFYPYAGSGSGEDFPFCMSVHFYKAAGESLIQLTRSAFSDAIAPALQIHINVGNYLWREVEDAMLQEGLMAHAIGRAIGLSEIQNKDEYLYESKGDKSIMLSPVHVPSDPYLWTFGVTGLDKMQLQKMYEDDDIVDYDICLNGTNSLEDECLLAGKKYFISFLNSDGCCSEDDIKILEVVNDQGSIINTYRTTGDGVELTINECGMYTVNFRVDNAILDSHVHEQTLIVNVVNGFDFEFPEEVELNTPYVIRYYYGSSSSQNLSVSYSAGESLFDNGGQQNVNLNIKGNEVEVELFRNGCYFIKAIICDGRVPIDTAYCNITKLEHLPDVCMEKLDTLCSHITPYTTNRIDTDSGEIARYFYDIWFENLSDLHDRFGCLVQSFYENRNDFSWEDYYVQPRRVDRGFGVDYRIFKQESIQPLCKYALPSLYWVQNDTPNENGLKRWRYEYYTGNICYPMNGIYEVESDSIFDLPMQMNYVEVLGAGSNVANDNY
ncbi:MAG: hypothetical protein J6K24_05970 [Tidjanibacter sp.]|nr:hypothetical protein [Tidjanibacter sp.]